MLEHGYFYIKGAVIYTSNTLGGEFVFMKKRVVGAVLITILCIGVLAGCGRKVCSFCGQKKYTKSKTVLGAKVDICNDCLDTFEAILK